MLKQLSELHQKCFPHKPWNENDFNELKKSGCEIIASDNGFIIWRSVLDEAELITIGVNPDERGNGIASAMIGIMENELKKTGVKKIFLEVSVDNTAAIALYKKLEFNQIAIRPKYYLPAGNSAKAGDGIDAIVMDKNL